MNKTMNNKNDVDDAEVYEGCQLFHQISNVDGHK